MLLEDACFIALFFTTMEGALLIICFPPPRSLLYWPPLELLCFLSEEIALFLLLLLPMLHLLLFLLLWLASTDRLNSRHLI